MDPALPPAATVDRVALADAAGLVTLGEAAGHAAAARVLPYVVHDGWLLPDAPDPGRPDLPWPPALLEWCRDRVAVHRDWGGEAVVHALANALGVGDYFRVRLARSVLDFGRVADFTWARDSTHLQRRALPHRIMQALPRHPQLAGLLDYYDEIWRRWTAAVEGRLEAARRVGDTSMKALDAPGPILIAVHTYDRCDAHGAVRPPACLLYRPEPGPDAEALPPDLFDPLFPRHLADFTADRLLANRMALELERARVPVAHHEVYHLPAGSVELRTQVWLFFHHLREVLRASSAPELVALGNHAALWRVLMEVHGRDAAAIAARRQMRGTSRRDGVDPELAAAYATLRRYLAEHPEVVRDYQHSPRRPSSIAIELRKDVLFERGASSFAGARLRLDHVEEIATVLATAVRRYIEHDQPIKARGAHGWWSH